MPKLENSFVKETTKLAEIIPFKLVKLIQEPLCMIGPTFSN